MAAIVHTLGYTCPDAARIMVPVMGSDPMTLLVDICYNPSSRWSPQWSKKALEAAWGDRY